MDDRRLTCKDSTNPQDSTLLSECGVDFYSVFGEAKTGRKPLEKMAVGLRKDTPEGSCQLIESATKDR
jgi:hypothetical protein